MLPAQSPKVDTPAKKLVVAKKPLPKKPVTIDISEREPGELSCDDDDDGDANHKEADGGKNEREDPTAEVSMDVTECVNDNQGKDIVDERLVKHKIPIERVSRETSNQTSDNCVSTVTVGDRQCERPVDGGSPTTSAAADRDCELIQTARTEHHVDKVDVVHKEGICSVAETPSILSDVETGHELRSRADAVRDVDTDNVDGASLVTELELPHQDSPSRLTKVDGQQLPSPTISKTCDTVTDEVDNISIGMINLKEQIICFLCIFYPLLVPIMVHCK